MIQQKTYLLKTQELINKDTLTHFINAFWNEEFTTIISTSKNRHLMILCKIQFIDSDTISDINYKTLGPLRRVEYKDKDLFIEYLTERLGLILDSYNPKPVSKIIFTYLIKEGLISTDDRRLLKDLSVIEKPTHTFNKIKLPATMNPFDYGTILNNPSIINGYIRYITTLNNRIFQIDVTLDKLINHVTILGAIDLKWTDTRVLVNGICGDAFKREIGKSTLYFLGGEIVIIKKLLNSKEFKKFKRNKTLLTNFVVMDIETIVKNNILIPYLIVACNGAEFITSYNENIYLLMSKFINDLLTFFKPRTNTMNVYAHNFSSFDGIFLIRHLLQFGKVEPLLFNGKLISIKLIITIEGPYKGKIIIFKDSYLMLPQSLRALSITYNCEQPKGHFPFNLNNINYVGIFPRFKFFKSINPKDYVTEALKFRGKIWNFKDEAIKYCKLDCINLHHILTKFNELIFKEFKVNIHNSLTLPSLSLRIFQTLFMKDESIYQIHGLIEQDIRQSYTGGAVDVYIPHNKINKEYETLYVYDVNSLYPTVMSTKLLPYGKPSVFNGNIRKIINDAYGFFYCKITSPTYLEHPIIQRTIKTNEGLRTIAGLGQWEGWIYSNEMDNAIKYGYTFEIIKGYQFDQGDLFNDLISKLYELRLQYPKSDPMNMIAKLLMNSLYGKFGMKDEITILEILNNITPEDKLIINNLLEKYGTSITDILQLETHTLLVRKSFNKINYNPSDDFFHGAEVNVAVASAITAEARIFMSQFKNNPNFKLYYSDTDSIVTNKPLPEHLVGNALGQLKLEYTIKKAIFLAPKVYAFITNDNQEIIKVKGLTKNAINNINFNDFEALLIQDSSKTFTQEKLLKSVIHGQIKTLDMLYTLKVTSNKRELIYINYQDKKLFNYTKPFNYNEINKNNI